MAPNIKNIKKSKFQYLGDTKYFFNEQKIENTSIKGE